MNPHRCKNFKKKPWCMYLRQVCFVLFCFRPGLKKEKSITVGQYSVNTISWFLILSKHTESGVLIHPEEINPFFHLQIPFLFWRREIIFIVYWILVWKHIKYVWTATTVFTIYKPYFIDICRSDVNMSTYFCQPSVGEAAPLRGSGVFSLILSKLT